MKIAIPTAQGLLCPHFGHCESFAIIDTADGRIVGRTDMVPPPHEPGLLPRWIAAQKVNLIISGGMGNRAQSIFIQTGVEVIVGAPVDMPEKLVGQYLAGTLKTGANACDH